MNKITIADLSEELLDVINGQRALINKLAELAKRPASKRFTYGLRGSSILAALAAVPAP